jgi:DNA-binding CsgD family transcriptional regulator/putative methionine-R-sulfoxide reductase with GAF domain
VTDKIMEQPEHGSTNMVGLLTSILTWAVEILGVDTGEIYLYDALEQALTLRVACGQMVEMHLGISLKPGEGLAGKVFESGAATVVDDYRLWEGRSPAFRDPLSCSELAVPLVFESRTIGVLIFATDADRRHFSQDDIRLATLCGNLAAVAIENARLYEQLHNSVLRLRRTLEEEITERMGELAHRAVQLESGSAIVEDTATTPDIDELLGRVMELKIARKVLDEVTRIPVDPLSVDHFTPREVEILTLVAKGFSNKEIARHLSIALSTVKFHVSSILGKLHISDRTRAALWAVNRGLVKADEARLLHDEAPRL